MISQLKKVLLISYYFDPYKGVGAKRMSYWAKAFFEDKVAPFTCSVLTATPQPAVDPLIIYLEDRMDSWMDKFVRGISWVPALKRFFRSLTTQYDIIVISGGPFGHFWITRFLKKGHYGKIVLDFRDPFSRNGRFQTHFIKEYIKVLFEKAFLKYADRVITVNDFCKQLLSENISPGKISIVENGYDEKILDAIPVLRFDDGLIHIVYAGSFYNDRNPDLFLKQLMAFCKRFRKFRFHHIGSPSEFLQPFRGLAFLEEHGEKTYAEALEIMKKCNLGLIITGGEPMESTTKIYDYIGCDLDILVITNGQIRTGSINAITVKVEQNVHWRRNDEKEITEFLESYEFAGRVISDKHSFSRLHGFQQLKEILREI